VSKYSAEIIGWSILDAPPLRERSLLDRYRDHLWDDGVMPETLAKLVELEYRLRNQFAARVSAWEWKYVLPRFVGGVGEL